MPATIARRSSNGGGGPSKMLTAPMCIGVVSFSTCRKDESTGLIHSMRPPTGRRARARAPGRPPGGPTCRSGSSRPRPPPRRGPRTRCQSTMPSLREYTATASMPSGERRQQVLAERRAALAVPAARREHARQPEVAEQRHPAHGAQHLRRDGQAVAHGRAEHHQAATRCRGGARRARARACRRGSGRSARPARRCPRRSCSSCCLQARDDPLGAADVDAHAAHRHAVPAAPQPVAHARPASCRRP